jgi:hypothetical protein
MNARTVIRFILALVLMTSAVSVYAAEQLGPGHPYTGPDAPVMTTG